MELTLDHASLIGQGLSAQVYAWNEGRVLKLYPSSRSRSDVEREFSVTQAVRAAGFPAPAAYELVELQGRPGIIFERLRGVTMLKQVEARPLTLFAAARQLGELHAQLHQCPAPLNLPSQRQQLEGWIGAAKNLPEDKRNAARRLLAQFPEGNALCHGDFHPENILMTPSGPMVIDWSNGTRGQALADVAFTSLLFQKANLPAATPRRIHLLFKVSRALLHRSYLTRYLQLRPGTRAEIAGWMPVLEVAIARWRLEGVSQLSSEITGSAGKTPPSAADFGPAR